MKKRTYNNFMRAVSIIQGKGYGFDEATEIVRRCFDNMEQTRNGMSLEWWLDKIIPRAEFLT